MKKLSTMFIVCFIVLGIFGCGVGSINEKEYTDLVKAQTLDAFALTSGASLGDIFDTINHRKSKWSAWPAKQDDSEYRYRNIHKTSVVVEVEWATNTVTLGIPEVMQPKKTMIFTYWFLVNRDKSEFELYKTFTNGQEESGQEVANTVGAAATMYNMIIQDTNSQD